MGCPNVEWQINSCMNRRFSLFFMPESPLIISTTCVTPPVSPRFKRRTGFSVSCHGIGQIGSILQSLFSFRFNGMGWDLCTDPSHIGNLATPAFHILYGVLYAQFARLHIRTSLYSKSRVVLHSAFIFSFVIEDAHPGTGAPNAEIASVSVFFLFSCKETSASIFYGRFCGLAPFNTDGWSLR